MHAPRRWPWSSDYDPECTSAQFVNFHAWGIVLILLPFKAGYLYLDWALHLLYWLHFSAIAIAIVGIYLKFCTCYYRSYNVIVTKSMVQGFSWNVIVAYLVKKFSPFIKVTVSLLLTKVHFDVILIGLPSGFFILGFWVKFCMHFSYACYMFLITLIILILNSTNFEAPHFVISFIFMLLGPYILITSVFYPWSKRSRCKSSIFIFMFLSKTQ
jgi:hypothetical protein